MSINNRAIRVVKNRLKWASYFMAYPYYAIIQNVSFFFMITYYLSVIRLSVKTFRIGSVMSIGAFIFALGAVISTMGTVINFDTSTFMTSLAVLPNYLYWAVIIILLGNTALKIFSLDKFYEFFFWGIVSSTLSFYMFNSLFSNLPIYRSQSPNNFAFLLIIFSPMATAFVQKRWSNTLYTIVFIIIITVAGFMSGSRSGSLLTFFGCTLVIAIQNWIKIIFVCFLGLFTSIATPQILDNPAIKNSMLNLNERTYELVYETDNTLKTDRSYLTRLAMIEKGMNIFEEHPIAGVGIGNFHRVKGEINFDFEGSELMEYKNEYLEEGISAHNSYISFLSEGGLVLFIPFLFLILYPSFYFLINFSRIIEYEKAIFISIVFMSIHAWFIVGMVNVFGWFILGIANSYIIHRDIKKQ